MADVRDRLQGLDLDTGAGSDLILGVNLRGPASGGSIEVTILDGDVVAAATRAFVIAGTDGSNYQVLKTDSTGSLQVDIESSVTITVDTELPAAAALADNAGNPTTPLIGACLLGFDGTNWDRIYTIADGDAVAAGTKGFLVFGTDGANYQALAVDASGNLQVDVLTGGGTDTPTNPVNSYQTSAALAAGSTAALTTAEATSKKLAWVEVWASVAYKAAVHTVDNGVESTNPIMIGGGPAFVQCRFETRHRNYITLGATAGLDAFRVNVTNLDDALAADVYATFHYED